MKRKEFIKLASTGALGISSLGYISCESQKNYFLNYHLLNGHFITCFRVVKNLHMNLLKFQKS